MLYGLILTNIISGSIIHIKEEKGGKKYASRVTIGS